MPAAYKRIVDDIRARIASGDLAPDTKLPTKRELAELYGVSPHSVDTAMAVLQDSGHVRGEQGRATYVAPGPYRGVTAD